MARLALASSFVASVSLLGCGSVDQTGPTDPGDTTSPQISSVTPAHGQQGVPADTAIVISFNEAMDQASVEAAYASADLPKDAVTLSWNDAGDTLTIAPKQPLALAEGIGNDPSVITAKQYALSLAATATDEAGNPLAAPLAHAFTTSRRMATTAPVVAALTRYRVSNGGVSAVGDDLRIGDNAMLTYRGFVTFDLLKLPGGAEIENATFGVRQTAFTGTPFDMGVVNTVHIVYGIVDSTAWNAVPLGMMDPLTTTTAVGPRSVDVTAAVADDYADRATRSNRSQYRLEFPSLTNGDGDQDTIELATATFEMSLVYLVP